MRRAAALSILVLVVLAAGCGDDGDDGASSSTSTTTTAPDDTTTTEATTTTLGEPCPDTAIPSETKDATFADGDVDGDRGTDIVSTYLDGETWRLSVELAAGGGAVLDLQIVPGGAAAVLGAADLDGDGGDEVFAQVGSGASATIVGIARFSSCALTRVALPSGDPAELPVGGSVGSPAGIACGEGADLTAYTGFLGDDDVYDITVTPYDLSDGVLTAGTPTAIEVQMDDPALARYTGLSCDDVAL